MTVERTVSQASWHQRIRQWHKWLGVVVGVQMIIWMVSGLYMVCIDIEKIHGDHFVTTPTPLIDSTIAAVPSKYQRAKRILLANQLNKNVYIINNRWLIDAQSGAPINVDKSYVTKRAQELFSGTGSIKSIEKLNRYPDEIGGQNRQVWRVDFDASFNPSFYFSPQTAQLLRKRSDLWRMFDFLWTLHIMDYQDGEDSHNTLLLIAAIVAILLITSGIWLIFYALWLPAPVGKLGWVVNIHRWLVLIIGIQMLLWAASGLAFNILSSDKTNANITASRMSTTEFSPQLVDFNHIKQAYPTASRINLVATTNQPLIYITAQKQLAPLTLNLENKLLSKAQVIELSKLAINDDLPILSVKLLQQKTPESRQFKSPVWQINYDNDQHSALYIDAHSGKILKVIEDKWRLRDFFWMLHIMDYQDHSDFNHPLIITASILAVVGSLAGGLLVFFTIGFKRRKKEQRLIITVDGSQTIETLAHQTLLNALNRDEQLVPSGCGGKGTCGQCVLAINDHDQPLNQQEHMTLRDNEINAGLRLSCQTKVVTDLSVELNRTNTFSPLNAQVIKTRLVTPFIKEITLKTSANFRYAAGQSINITIPIGQYRINTSDISDKYQTQWANLLSQSPVANVEQAQQRSYSLANESISDGTITLLVKLVHHGNNLGIGSGYLFSLSAGQSIEIQGPLGDFSLNKQHDREVILIGAGSGMAPLKAMAEQAVNQHRPRVSLWYGARTEADIVMPDYFDNLSKRHKNFQWRVSLSQAKPQTQTEQWQGLTGYIQSHLFDNYLRKHPDLSAIDFYLCGPHKMMDEIRQHLISQGVRHQQIKRDSFD
ncbi:MAG: hypothetical protein BM565_05920 [Gammaproteobacteria bacterium MedPE]|nr:MAG: hypothetical protein BM565_05920 [Gammaproteobacteria bacterium MedPE]